MALGDLIYVHGGSALACSRSGGALLYKSAAVRLTSVFTPRTYTDPDGETHSLWQRMSDEWTLGTGNVRFVDDNSETQGSANYTRNDTVMPQSFPAEVVLSYMTSYYGNSGDPGCTGQCTARQSGAALSVSGVPAPKPAEYGQTQTYGRIKLTFGANGALTKLQKL